MARVAEHLSVEDLEARLRSARDPTATRHCQVIWLLARGHTIADVAAVTSFVPRWIEQLLARYNAHGPEAPGQRIQVNKTAKERPGWSLVVVIPRLKLAIVARFCSMTAPFQCTKLSSERHKGRANQAR